MTAMAGDEDSARRGMPMFLAGAVVFFTSFVVLVLEILGSRLLAPFIGVTLQTYTAVIGTILTGISLGTWFGGSLADRYEPRRILGPIILGGGIFVLLTVPVARWLGPELGTRGAFAIIGLSFLTLFLPAAVLSAVNPTIVKIQLSSLQRTGRTVGQLSALATAGAITGTFATGFVLVATFPIAPVIAVAGGSLVIVGGFIIVLQAATTRTMAATMAIVLIAGTTGASLTFAAPNPCDIESSYFCIKVLGDASRPTVRLLKLDDIFHSEEDLANPKSLGFWYTKVIGAVADHIQQPGVPISALSLGAGAITLPRYILATRPGSKNQVLEIDPAILKVDEQQFGVTLSNDLRVHIGDARTRLPKLAGSNFDLVIGDAFGSESVPWQLTTRQFDEEIAKAMSPNAVYVMNLIDYGDQRFVRAEAKTLQTVFRNVAAIGQPEPHTSHAIAGGNVELIATNATLDGQTVASWLQAERPTVLYGDALNAYIGSSRILTDDFAPVDQLITNPKF